MVALCDPDSKRLEFATAEHEKATGVKARCVQDPRKILEDSSIDVISVATTNQWHALLTLWALQAGKHVYVGSPCRTSCRKGE